MNTAIYATLYLGYVDVFTERTLLIAMNKLTYNEKEFLLDGEPFRILSGAIHYFRVHPAYWEDRLKKLKACGFNTVETYCCWNLHEKQEGEFDFTSMLDVQRFLKIAQEVGLYAIVRPGPYICAEFDYGGLPYWLNNYPLHLRCYDELYLEKVRSYFGRLCDQIRPQLGENGGNVIAMQIENEYGSYGNDKDYLRAIAEIYQENGMNCLYFTSDGYDAPMLSGGSLPEYLETCNFGSRAQAALESLRRFQPDGPFLCTEFWNGWFDHWGEEHHVTSPDDAVREMNEILDANDGTGNLNFYMFHGGTNFGFTNGANFPDRYEPAVTSYDYDCPVSECGDLTPKYFKVKEALERRFGKAADIPVSNARKAAYGRVALTKKGGLFHNLDRLSRPVTTAYPQTMEELKLPFGFVMYSTTLWGAFDDGNNQKFCVELDGMRDRALIYINGELKGIKEAFGDRNDEVAVTCGPDDAVRLDILVENMGRVNYGAQMGEKKGLSSVRVGYVHHSGWTMYPMELTDLSAIEYTDYQEGQPAFFAGSFTVEGEPSDTFLRLEGLTKGVAFVNGFNLGRYWNEKGPQKTLYVPAPVLKKGENKVVVFELEKAEKMFVTLEDAPDLG